MNEYGAQAKLAESLIAEGMAEGHWVFLANCHLLLSWLPALEWAVNRLDAKQPHSAFRLWLSTTPSPEFPVALLQAGVKIVNEPPQVWQGLRLAVGGKL